MTRRTKNVRIDNTLVTPSTDPRRAASVNEWYPMPTWPHSLRVNVKVFSSESPQPLLAEATGELPIRPGD